MRTVLVWILIWIQVFPVLRALALGDQELLYSRQDCTFNGNGLAKECAASAGALGARKGLNNVLWSATDGTAGSVDPNDILYICGPHDVTDVFTRLRPTVDGNATDGHIITSLDCPGNRGSITSSNNQARLVWWDSRFFHKIQGPGTISGGAANDFVFSCYDSAQQDRDRHLIVDGIHFEGPFNATAVFWCWGAHITVINSSMNNTANDAFYYKGGRNSTFTRNRITTVTGPADCFQQDASGISDTGTVTVTENYCDKTGAQDIKYGLLVGPVNGPTDVSWNTTICPSVSLSPSGCSGILIDTKVDVSNNTTAEITAIGNLIRRGWRGFTLYRGVNAGFRQQIVGNDVCDAGTLGIWLNSTVDNVMIANNTFCRNGLLAAGASGEHAVYVGKPNSTDIDLVNNLFANGQKGYYFNGTFGGTVSHNAYFGQVAYNIEKAGAGSQAIEGTGLTADPKFLNASVDGRLDGPSLLRGAGTVVAECIARDGQLCTTPPSIGAYQYHHGGAPTGVITSAAGPL